MRMLDYYTDWDDRINRKSWWLYGFIPSNVLWTLSTGIEISSYRYLVTAGFIVFISLLVVIFATKLAGGWIALVTGVQRLHDLGITGTAIWLFPIAAFVAPYIFDVILWSLGYESFSSSKNAGKYASFDRVSGISYFVVGILQIAILGLIPGKAEPNDYGPPPR